MDTWFEVVILLYGFIYLSFQFIKLVGQLDFTPELSEELKNKIYS